MLLQLTYTDHLIVIFYMKIPEGFKMPETSSSKTKELYWIKLQRSLCRLK